MCVDVHNFGLFVVDLLDENNYSCDKNMLYYCVVSVCLDRMIPHKTIGIIRSCSFSRKEFEVTGALRFTSSYYFRFQPAR